MIGEYILAIYTPFDHKEWILLQTDKSLYSIRLGGFKIEKDLELSNYTKKTIAEHNVLEYICSDGEWVYVVYNNSVISFGIGEITESDSQFTYFIKEKSEYADILYDNDICKELTIGQDGWSKKV